MQSYSAEYLGYRRAETRAGDKMSTPKSKKVDGAGTARARKALSMGFEAATHVAQTPHLHLHPPSTVPWRCEID